MIKIRPSNFSIIDQSTKNEYNSGKVKRKLAFLDTLIYAMDVQKVHC